MRDAHKWQVHGKILSRMEGIKRYLNMRQTGDLWFYSTFVLPPVPFLFLFVSACAGTYEFQIITTPLLSAENILAPWRKDSIESCSKVRIMLSSDWFIVVTSPWSVVAISLFRVRGVLLSLRNLSRESIKSGQEGVPAQLCSGKRGMRIKLGKGNNRV